MRVLIGTRNRGKLEEIKEILADFGIEGISPEEAGVQIEVEEGGESLEENALMKARAYSKASGLLTLSEDSGLFVKALSGRPGVFSSRYGRTDKERCERVLEELKGVPFEKRKAYFECVAVLSSPEGDVWVRRGRCDGYIDFEMKGDKGFGYDPIFFSPEAGKNFAELEREEKSKISHRGKAVREIAELIVRLELKRIEISKLKKIITLINENEAYLGEVDGKGVYKRLVEEVKRTKLSEIESGVIEEFLTKWGWLQRRGLDWEKITERIREIADELEEVRGKDIKEIEDLEKLRVYYERLREVAGDVGASKTLHLIAPGLFPPWDDAIKRAIKEEIKEKRRIAPPALYIEFMKFIRRLIEENEEVLKELCERYGKSEVKLIDEYLWWKISRRPLFDIAGGGI